MYARSDRKQILIDKIRDLSEGRLSQVEDFVDFLRARDMECDPVTDSSAMSSSEEAAGRRLDRMYEQYVKPVEQEHLGEYVVVTPAGDMYFAQTQSELVKKTMHLREGGNGLFRVGEIAAATLL